MPHGNIHTAVLGKGMNADALVSDGRFSGATGGLAIGHVVPEAYEGGNIALIQDEIWWKSISRRKLICTFPTKSWPGAGKPGPGGEALQRVAEAVQEEYIPCDKGATIFWD